MQNRYTGDIGDYGKLGLLRVLQNEGLSIGVNWYLVPDETHNGDGRHIQYLTNETIGQCDMTLWTELNHIVGSGERAVSALQKDSILKAAFYSEPLDFTDESRTGRAEKRKAWHHAALNHLRGTDIVFVDPDNGILVPSAEGTRKENKFVRTEELEAYYRGGSSVIYYQHKARKPDAFYSDQHARILRQINLNESTGLALKFRTTSQRYYFFIIQPCHRETINDAVCRMLASEWGNHFSIL